MIHNNVSIMSIGHRSPDLDDTIRSKLPGSSLGKHHCHTPPAFTVSEPLAVVVVQLPGLQPGTRDG